MNQPMGLCHTATWYQDHSNIFNESLQADDTSDAFDFVAPDPFYFIGDSDAQSNINYHSPSPIHEESGPIRVDLDYTDTPQIFTKFFPGCSDLYPGGATFMDIFWQDKYTQEWQENLYYPFTSDKEWEFSSWCLHSGLSMAAIDSLLSLSIVSRQIFCLD